MSRSSLLDWLMARYPRAKRTTLRRMIQAGRVLINEQRARSLKDAIGSGDSVRVLDARQRPAPRPPAPPLPILYEDDDILVIDKPAGLLTSTVPRERRPTALAIVRQYVRAHAPQARVGLIHRLDRDASGLLVFSKNNLAYESLKAQFSRHEVQRIYSAVVRGKITPPAGRIESRLLELPDGRVVTTRQPGKGRRAVTEYRTLWSSKAASLLRVELQTGRKHQIRAHLSERGTPILNDPLYDSAPPSGRLMLAATELAIDHPRSGRRLHLRLDPPPEMQLPLPSPARPAQRHRER